MSYKSQSANMIKLHSLLKNDLGYIWGERESGPSGDKKKFHTTGRAFLSALGKELGFGEFKVKKSHSGIAVSGEVSLIGLWREGNGLYIQLRQDLMFNTCILYRSIRHMKDYSGGANNFIGMSDMMAGEYDWLLSKFLKFKEAGYESSAA